MNEPEPLVSIEARLLCLSKRTPIAIVTDRLLRLQNESRWRQPILLYLLGADDGDGSSQSSLSALDFLTLYSVLRTLRSPVHGVALGLLRGYEPLVLAACERGHRLLLPTAMACVGPFEIGQLPLSDTAVGLTHSAGLSLREQAKTLVQAQLNVILNELGLDPSFWQQPKVLMAESTIKIGLADAIVPMAELTKTTQPAHVPER